MRLLHGFAVCALLAAICSAFGCRSPQRAGESRIQSDVQQVEQSDSVVRKVVADRQVQDTIRPVSHQSDGEPVPSANTGEDDPFAESTELSLDVLMAVVRARNPSLQAAQAAWGAAAERSPQAVALDDPMFQSMFAPASFASNNSQSSYYLGFAQRVPWHGKRALQGEMARWEAAAASWDAEEVKLRLDVATRLSFFDYYLVHRELELNQKNVEVMQEFRSTAKTKYEANQASQQDLSAADLELAKLRRRRLELRQAERTSIARINTLLHRRPDHSLPLPPGRLDMNTGLPESAELRDTAIHKRPELAALASRLQAEQNAVALAMKQYYPDFEFMARYDSFWTDAQQRPQVGMNMSLPVRRDKLAAAVREAQFRCTKLAAEYAQQRDMVNEEVEIAFARVQTNGESVALYESTILPSAESYLESGRAAYVAGTVDFLSLMEALRQYIEQQIEYQRSLTEYHRSYADLERAVGMPLDEVMAPASGLIKAPTEDP